MLEARNIGNVFAGAVEFLSIFDLGSKEKMQTKSAKRDNHDMADMEGHSSNEPVNEILMRR